MPVPGVRAESLFLIASELGIAHVELTKHRAWRCRRGSAANFCTDPVRVRRSPPRRLGLLDGGKTVFAASPASTPVVLAMPVRQ